MIYVDSLNVQEQIRKLMFAVDRCNDSIKGLRRMIDVSEGIWKGRGGDSARQILNDRIVKLEGIKSDILSVASLIERVAEDIIQKDKQASLA